VFTYPQAEKKFEHSLGVRALSSFPISFQSASMVRFAALRSSALSLEKSFSMGL